MQAPQKKDEALLRAVVELPMDKRSAFQGVGPCSSPVGQMVCVCFLLILAIIAVFGQTAGFAFVEYDDGENVFENPVVAKGLSTQSVCWAFTHPQVGNWVPLTTLSHMLDCQLFGLRAGGHHGVNVLWHTATALLLFLVLRQTTGSLWRSAFVAAVFAVHPLRAESVAWVSERKDVLSGFFFIAAIWAYVRYARAPSRRGYVALVFLFVCGLLAKSMVATLPFVLLLLDYWPLGRFSTTRELFCLIREKAPLFAISAAACVATALVPGLVVANNHRLPLLARIANALVSYMVYLGQILFPRRLATPYPFASTGASPWEVCLAVLLLTAISAIVIARRKKYPWLLMGWLWYLGMLVPVIGIVQISEDAAHADRYTYLPEIGLAIAAVWAMADGCARWKDRRVVCGGMMLASIGILGTLGHIQTAYWRNDTSLWTHTLASTTGNSLAHNNLGLALAKGGKLEEAITQFSDALSIKPNSLSALNNLGGTYAREGKLDEAIAQFTAAVRIDPASKGSQYDLAVVLSAKGETQASIAHYRKALEIDPDFADAHFNLGILLSKTGHVEEALAQFRKVLEINPEDSEARAKLGEVLYAKAETEEAIAEYRKSIKLNPRFAEAWVDLGLACFERGEIKEAIDSWQQALKLYEASNPMRDTTQ